VELQEVVVPLFDAVGADRKADEDVVQSVWFGGGELFGGVGDGELERHGGDCACGSVSVLSLRDEAMSRADWLAWATAVAGE